MFHPFQSHHKHYGWLVFFSKYLLEMKGIFTCTFGQLKFKNNQFLQGSIGPRLTPLFKQLCEKLILLERITL